MTRSRRRRRQQLRAVATAVAAFAVAAALLACQGGLSVTEATARAARSEERAAGADPAGSDPALADPADVRPTGEAAAAREEAADALAPALAIPVAAQPPAGAAAPAEPRADGAPAAQPPRAPADPPVIDDMWPNKGPATGGDRVEIRGRNLQPSLVLFGSVPATVLGVREDRGIITLTLELPPARAGAARVYVVVTNGDGQYAVAGERFEYYN
ncbi:MAG TPA: IPT/TIG domain-containing protein [Anaeromyxobacteraceae bacterium]|nr:IPT/TIG domain-containing protein [Anaeromyxobacteraceae bacterium]